MPVVDERVGRHDLDRGDAELGQMLNRRRMSEAREGPARGFGDRRVEPREAAQVELVDDQRLRRDALMSRLSRGRRSPAIAFGVCGPVSSPNLNIEGWSWNGRSKRQA